MSVSFAPLARRTPSLSNAKVVTPDLWPLKVMIIVAVLESHNLTLPSPYLSRVNTTLQDRNDQLDLPNGEDIQVSSAVSDDCHLRITSWVLPPAEQFSLLDIPT